MTSTLHFSPPISATPIKHTELEPITKDRTFPTGFFTNCKTFTEVKQLHAKITKTGFNQNPSYIKELITSCTEISTFDSLNYAQKALELFIKDNGTTSDTCYMFNSLIRSYSSNGVSDKAVRLFCTMLCHVVFPDKFTFPFVLSGCAKGNAFGEGLQIHGVICKMGFDCDIFVQNSLIHFFGECGEIELMRKVFDKMSERNVVSWTSLIGGYVKMDFPKEAVSLFFDMVDSGIKPNSVTMVSVISAVAKLQDIELGEKVRGYVDEFGVEVNTLMVNALVDMYMKCGAVDQAKELFDECAEKNLVLFNTMMSNFGRHGLPQEALDLLNELMQHGLRPDKVTMLSAISACSQLGDIMYGKCCHGYVVRHGLEGWDNLCNAMIDMYMKCGKQEVACKIFDCMPNKTTVSWNSVIAGFIRRGDVESAWEIFREMPNSDLVSWNTMIGALVQESKFEKAIDLFRVMQDEGMKADRVTMVAVASACGYLGALDIAKWIHAYIEKNEIPCDMKLSTALIDMYARCGDTQNALHVFNKMVKRDVSAWTAAIGAMALGGNGESAIELFNEMLSEGTKPDGVVFVGLLTALSHCGLVKQGWDFFMSMKDIYGITPQVVHYGCMVDLLGRAGLLNEALELIKGMPMEPNDVIWSSLLAACRMHKNVDIAAYAAERITELDPKRAGSLVLLSNIYASAGKWSDVAKIRLQLREQGIQKVPGSSSVEINGKIYEFTCADDRGLEMTQIEPMLEEMNCRLRDAGHTPDLATVLLDVEEQEKEYLLSRHSEKKAIAFALIGTSQGTPIRIAKNLRICSDCHTFAKLVSKLYDREITVRDNNRFHFFQQGSCSCNDYW